jgi:hypothetical protein
MKGFQPRAKWSRIPANTQGLDGRLDVGETRRATIQEAARIMGVSEGAIRKRVKRGTIAHDKGEDGRVYVYLDAGVDKGVDGVSHPERDALVSELRSHNATLREQLEAEREANRENRRIIAALTSRIPELPAPEPRDQAQEEEPTANTPPDERLYAVTPTPQPGRVEPQPQGEGDQDPRESSEMHMPEAGGGPLPHDQQTPSERPWWRRMFGG